MEIRWNVISCRRTLAGLCFYTSVESFVTFMFDAGMQREEKEEEKQTINFRNVDKAN